MDFIAFFYAMGNWSENPCISHIINYTIECESAGKKHPYYGKSMSTNLPGSPHTMGFVSGNQFPKLSSFNGFGCLFPGYGKLMRKHMHFPCDEVYHKMGI